jgi:hypothetical protein
MAFGGFKGSFTGSSGNIGTSLAATGSVAVVAGDLVFGVLFESNGMSMSACADNLGNTYTLFAGTDAGLATAVCAYATVTKPGTLTTITATTNGGVNDGVFDCIVMEGPFDLSPADKHPTDISNDITTPYLSAATGTLSMPQQVVIAWASSGGAAVWAVASPFTLQSQHAIASTGSVRLATQTVSSTASVAAASWTGTAAADDVLGIASFKAAVPQGFDQIPQYRKVPPRPNSAVMAAAAGLIRPAGSPAPLPQGWDQTPQYRKVPQRPNATAVMAAAAGLILCPTPPTAVSAAPFVFTVTTGQVFTRTLQFQDTAWCPQAPVVAAVVTADTWLQRWQGPPRVLRGLPGGQPFVPEEATRENTTNTVWPLVLGEIARPPVRIAQQGQHLFVPREATIDNTTGVLWPLKVQSEKASPIGRPAPQGWHLFIPDEATSQNTTNKVWPLVFGEKARPLPLPAQQGQHLFVPEEATVENTTNRVWPLTFGEKARPLPLPAPAGMWAFSYVTPFVDNNQTIDKWQQPLGRAAPILRPAPGGWWAFGYPYLGVDNTIGIEKWQQPLTRSAPIPRPAPVGGQPFVPTEVVFPNTVTPDYWLQRWQGPPRYWPIKVQALPFVPAEATSDNTTNRVWPLTQGEKARPIPRVAPPGGQPFVPKEAVLENTTVTVWPLTFGERARPILRPAAQGMWAFGYPYVSFDNTVTIEKWQQPLSVTINLGWPRRNYLRGGQPFVPKEATSENTVTPDKWLEAWRGPPHITARHTQPIYTTIVPAIAPNTIDGIPWLQRWQGPPRIRPRPTLPIYTTIVPVVYPNTITGIAWLEAWKGPPKYRPPRYDARYFFERRHIIVYGQTVEVDIELTIDMHVCGWGTETEAADEGIVQAESSDPWSEQTEQADAAVEQTEQVDASEEQVASTDEYDEKDECGR